MGWSLVGTVAMNLVLFICYQGGNEGKSNAQGAPTT